MSDEGDITHNLTTGESLRPTERIRPLGEVSNYVCDQLRYDIDDLTKGAGEEGSLRLEDWEERIEAMIAGIPEDVVSRLLDPSNTQDRRVALLDLFLLQKVIINRRELGDRDYVQKATKPVTKLETLRARLAEIEGIDWHNMPWYLTAKDYPITDIRIMFTDNAVAESERLLLVLQHDTEVNFFNAVSNLVHMLEALQVGNLSDEMRHSLQGTAHLVEQNDQLIRAFSLPKGHFENQLTEYYPSGAYAVGIFLIQAMLEGRTGPIMRRLVDLNDRQINLVDPDMRQFLQYVLNADHRLFPEMHLADDQDLLTLTAATKTFMDRFMRRHAGLATSNIDGGRRTIETRKPVVGDDGTVNAMDSLLGR